MTTLENLRKPDGFIALTDLFLERVRLNNLLERIEQRDMRKPYDSKKYSNLTFDWCVDALEEIDNIIEDVRWVEQNFDDSITEVEE